VPRGARDGQPVVPRATFDSYYGRPVLKAPTWKVPDVPGYLTAGGLAGASAVLAELAADTGRRRLARAARVASSVGAMVGVVALVHDLGRPERFLNMLRVFKPTSPLSVGSWVLAPFSGLSTVSALSDLTGTARPLGRIAGAGAAALGPAMATYTAVLLADTAVPAWHEAYRDLPFVFAASSAGAAGGTALIATPVAENAPAARLAALGGLAEIALAHRMESRLGFVGSAYRDGRAGRWLRAARGLTAIGALGALVGRRNRAVAAGAGAALVAGSVATRWGVFEAGRASAADPSYTVVPQRDRRDRVDQAVGGRDRRA
jgi:hypothetical protein